MKSKICCLFFLLTFLFCHLLYAQKEGNVWCFPDLRGIDFNNTANPDTFTSAITPTGFGFPWANQTSIADNNGNLFCYAAATQWNFHSLYMFDRNHQIMPNGHNLQGHPNYTSLLLPQPNNDSIISLLHIGRDTVNTNYYRLFYSTINKNLNGGYGDVVTKDSVIYYETLSQFKLAAVKHANGRDWWVLVYNYSSGAYHKFLLTPAGIAFYDSQILGSQAICVSAGYMTFSKDGTKLISVGNYLGCVDVFDFDRCTGMLSNYRDIGEHLATQDSMQYQYFNCEFSPNGNLIYVSTWNRTKVLYQWNLNAGNIAAIRASKTLLNQYPDTGMHQGTTYFLHKLAPDGKIYIPITSNYGSWFNTVYTHHLDVIENPDVPGVGCNYVQQAFDLGSHFVAGNMPNIPHYGLGPVLGSNCDSLVGIPQVGDQRNGIEVFPNPSQGIFSLRLKDKSDKIISVKVEDIFGNEIYSSHNFFSVIDIRERSSGIYFVRITTQKKKVFFARLVKI